MSFKLTIFFIIMSLNVAADTVEKELAGLDPKVDIIAENYQAGPYLIYDCVEKHWTCVLEEYYQECEEKRLEDQSLNKINLRCAPLKKFPTKKSCFQRQLFVTSQNFGTRFCIGKNWQDRELELD